MGEDGSVEKAFCFIRCLTSTNANVDLDYENNSNEIASDILKAIFSEVFVHQFTYSVLNESPSFKSFLKECGIMALASVTR